MRTTSKTNKLQKKTRLQCSLCSYIGANHQILQYHILKFHKYHRYLHIHKCKKCPYSAILKRNFAIHMKTVHSKIRKYVYCANCPYRSFTKHQLIDHMKFHFINAANKCKYCTFSSQTVGIVIKHQWIHGKSSEAKMYKCGKCTYITRIKYHFNRHVAQHEPADANSNLKYYCYTCEYSTIYKSCIARHVHSCLKRLSKPKKNKKEKPVKKKQPTFKCEHCSYKTAKIHHIKRHAAVHMKPLKSKSFKCAICSYTTSRKDALSRHMDVHENSGKVKAPLEQRKLLHACTTCNYTTNKKSGLDRHILTHMSTDEIKWFECKECPFKAKRKYQLTAHTKGHRTTEGIKCLHCTFHSKTLSVCLRHLKQHY